MMTLMNKSLTHFDSPRDEAIAANAYLLATGLLRVLLLR
jgi:hypothetical protein